MTIDEFRNTFRSLLNDAIRGGLEIDAIMAAADAELHPEFDLDIVLDPLSSGQRGD